MDGPWLSVPSSFIYFSISQPWKLLETVCIRRIDVISETTLPRKKKEKKWKMTWKEEGKGGKGRSASEKRERKTRSRKKKKRKIVDLLQLSPEWIDRLWFKWLKAIPTLKATQQDDPNEERDVTLHPSWCRRSLFGPFYHDRVSTESL